MDLKCTRILLAGLAAGDALGATTEFCWPALVRQLLQRHGPQGWPLVPVGMGHFGWRPGQPTDDSEMAMCLIRSHLRSGGWNAADAASAFCEWLDSGPRDIGRTTAAALRDVRGGAVALAGGQRAYLANPEGAANGALMRNGVIPGLAANLDEALTVSFEQGVITHYSPVSVLCCSLHTWLLDRLTTGSYPFNEAAWMESWHTDFVGWFDRHHIDGTPWYAEVGDAALGEAMGRLQEANWSPEGLDPWRTDLGPIQGGALITLRLAVWFLRMSAEADLDPKIPESLRCPATQQRGLAVVGWPALVGYDSDTYGATAGPLVAAAHAGTQAWPPGMLEKLEALAWFDEATSVPDLRLRD